MSVFIRDPTAACAEIKNGPFNTIRDKSELFVQE